MTAAKLKPDESWMDCPDCCGSMKCLTPVIPGNVTLCECETCGLEATFTVHDKAIGQMPPKGGE